MPLDLGVWAIIFVVGGAVVFLGYKKAPEMAEALGKTFTHFKIGKLKAEKEFKDLETTVKPL